MKTRGKKIFSMLSAILEPPTHRTIEHVLASIRIVEPVNPDAKLHLDVFRQFCLTNSLDRLREAYATAFDPDAACCPYVGHHLFCDERSRKLFLAKLREHYGPHMNSRSESPDHIAEMLRSLMVQDSIEEARDLIVYCLIPALRKMIPLCACKANPYQEILQAALLMLEMEEHLVLAF